MRAVRSKNRTVRHCLQWTAYSELHIPPVCLLFARNILLHIIIQYYSISYSAVSVGWLIKRLMVWVILNQCREFVKLTCLMCVNGALQDLCMYVSCMYVCMAVRRWRYGKVAPDTWSTTRSLCIWVGIIHFPILCKHLSLNSFGIVSV